MAKIKNKQELISKIKNAEGFSNEEKSQMLALLNENKTYGLVWEKSTEDAWEMMKDYVPVLKEDESKRIDHGSENPNHILIEGDNLNALTALSYTHEGKVDVIYIDPPYNTGNKDFVYNDSFVDAEDSYRHSKWLSFMEKRLKIARQLLTEKGVIFISIDNNEVAALKLLCDSVFGEGNFVEMLKWKRKKQPSFLARHTAPVMEYVLIYAHNYYLLEKLSIEGATDSTKKVLNISNLESSRSFKKGVRVKLEGNGIIKAGRYVNKTLSISFDRDVVYENGRTCNDVIVSGRFSDSQERIDSFINNDLLFITSNIGLRRDVSEEEKGRRKSITDLLLDWGDNQDSENEIKNIFGEVKFGYAKPVKLIYNLIKSFYSNETQVLDFFAGSGTTLHATMQLNAEDGGHRQCILVTNNENNICEEVTYERNKRVIEGYTTPKGEKVEGLKGNNLRYFKVGFTPREKTDENMFRLAKNSVNLLRIKHDVYKETQLGELENPYKRYRYFEEDGKQLLVILDTELIGDIVEQLEEMEVSKPIPTYVFATGAYPFTEDFESVADKVELYPLPYCLYQACERVMPKMIDREIENPEGISLSNEELETSMEDLTKEEA